MAYTNGGFGFGMKQTEREWSPPAAVPTPEPPPPPVIEEDRTPYTVDDPVTLNDNEEFITGRAELPPGAEPPKAQQTVVEFVDINGNIRKPDQRVIIRVPPKYLTRMTRGAKISSNSFHLQDAGGIIFPYTPSISYSYKAEYTTQTPIHTNFAQNFYKNSSLSEISISGKFTVENGADAHTYLSTVLLIKSLMRMRSGGALTGDIDSGSTPPVCRLSAYGDAMISNVPVVIKDFRVELPDNIDYFSYNGFGETNTVPTISTIQIVCLPMYSRDEMQQFSVDTFVKYAMYQGKGYL